MKIRGGIDLGKKGFISICVDNEGLNFFEIPKTGKEYNHKEVFSLFKSFKLQSNDIHFVLENVHARGGWGAITNFSLGECKGMLITAMLANDIPFTLVTPQKWQKFCFEGVPKQDTKLMSKIACKRLYPNIDLRRTVKCKNEDDNKSDSILMCYYAQKHF